MILDIVQIGDPVLRRKAHKITQIDRDARERLQHQAVLSVDDVNELMSGDKKFLNEYARIAGFPPFEPRIHGFRTWKVYEFLRPFKRTVKINMRSK